MKKGYFITATDTGVGKTVVTTVLGVLLKSRGFKVGIMKPVQCAGGDALFLKKMLGCEDELATINPYFLKEPLSPHLAMKRERLDFDIGKVIQAYRILQDKYDIVLVEGAGGISVPLKDNYLIADLIREMGLDIIIVSRLGLGTINHTLLTITQARECGLNIKGVIFNKTRLGRNGLAEKTNPQEIARFGKVKVLGNISYLKKINPQSIIKSCSGKVDIKEILDESNPSQASKLREYDKRYVWHPFTQMQDWLKSDTLIIEKGEGNYLIDTEGNRYLDGVSSLWVNVHGHRKREIDNAVKSQLNRIAHSTLLGLSNVPSINLAKKLIEIAPKGLQKVFYSDSGSTAVEAAIKIAYQYWQNKGFKEKKILAHLSNSYHGDTLGSVSVGGIDLFHRVYKGLIFESLKVDFPDFYRAPKGKSYPQYTVEILDRMEDLLRKKRNRIAALIIEPIVQGAAGIIVWPKGVLLRISKICRENGILLVADEVATGFGRTGKMFACEHENVSPDILCLAKGLSAGYLPLAATLVTQEIYDGFLFDYSKMKTFFHGHTYTGNPLACAAALANLEVFEKERTLIKLKPKIKYLEERLKEFSGLKNVGDVRQKGLMAAIELVKDKKTKAPFPWEERIGARICQEVRKNGVILRPLGNVIVIMPPLSVKKIEIAKIMETIYKAIRL
ncbi:MAG: adenosylmethionine--8-amino-7-oxononanoate transaminase [Candidatus Omnitrophica bacterium]|nr:adenosylmethionine--8-amino-7-oxononanoate transaminase [Candidatus Omnitrophota bacterium]